MLARLPYAIDRDYVAALQASAGALPPKRLRVLLVTDATMKYQERAILSVFGRAPLASCDCWQATHPARSLRPRLPRLRYVDADAARAGRYDRVVGFDAAAATVLAAAQHRCPAAFIGKVRDAPDERVREAAIGLVAPLDVYTTHRGTAYEETFDALLGAGRWRPRGGIDFPPNVDVHLAPAAEPSIPYLLPGGGDRDYELVWRARERFRARVLVTHADAPGLPEPAAEALARMRGDPRFALLRSLPPQRYARLLLNARVVLLPALGKAKFDYTSIADAVWYGRPVLTNRVQATRHLEDRVIFFEGVDELASRLRALEDPERWRAESRRAQARARATADLHRLALEAYEGL